MTLTFRLIWFRYPPGYSVQNLQFDFFNYAGLHRPVRLYTTPQNYLEDITVTTDIWPSFAFVKFQTVVGSVKGTSKGNFLLTYTLFDRESVIVASVNGSGLLSGKLKVAKPRLWWPIDMSEQPGYLYTLEVSC